MADKPTYYDKRADFWKKYWDMALTYDDFMLIDTENAPRWHDFMARIPDLNDEQKDLLRQLQKSFDDSNSHSHSPKKTGFFDSVKKFFEEMKP